MAALGAEAQRLLGFLASHVRKVDPKDPRTFISYKDVHDSLKLPVLGKFGSSLQRQGLDELAEWTVANDLPAITGIVVDRSKLEPGDGYFKLLGYPQDPYVRWLSEVARAKELDWAPYLTAPAQAGPPLPAGRPSVNLGLANVWRLVAYHESTLAAKAAAEMLSRGVVAIGWSDVGDLASSPPSGPDEVGRRIRASYPDLDNVAQGGPSLWRFFHELEVGDLVIVAAASKRVAVVEVIGDYYFAGTAGGVAGYAHLRSVVPTSLNPDELWRAAGSDVEAGENVRWTLARLASSSNAAQHAYVEGARYEIRSTAIERSPAARAACIEHHGVGCYVCGFDFFQKYGELGEGYIHVHHKTEISTRSGPYQVDPVRDLVPLCPNCHAMVHRKRPALDVDELKRILDSHLRERT